MRKNIKYMNRKLRLLRVVRNDYKKQKSLSLLKGILYS